MSIIAKNVSKIYDGKAVLKDISLEIRDGDFVTLSGQTGAGKTTLLRILAGIERPDKGNIYVDGKDVTGVPVQKRNIAMVYQQFINYPSFTIYENIASPLRVSKKRLSDDEIDKKVKANAELLGISQVLSHYPEEVSGGQKQRTAIARALIKDSNFILLDEPLANLDFKLREELRGELKRIFRSKGGAIMYATPDPLDALTMSSHVGFMHDGEIMQYGPVQEVYKNPRFVEVGAYFSYPTMNICESTMVTINNSLYLQVTDELTIDMSRFRDKLVKKEYLLGIHAHALTTVRKTEKMIPIEVTVDLAEVVGSDTEMHVTHKNTGLIMLMQDIVKFEIGKEITAYVDPDNLYIFDKDSSELVMKTAAD